MLTVALLLRATRAISSQSLYFKEQQDRFAHGRSFLERRERIANSHSFLKIDESKIAKIERVKSERSKERIPNPEYSVHTYSMSKGDPRGHTCVDLL